MAGSLLISIALGILAFLAVLVIVVLVYAGCLVLAGKTVRVPFLTFRTSLRLGIEMLAISIVLTIGFLLLFGSDPNPVESVVQMALQYVVMIAAFVFLLRQRTTVGVWRSIGVYFVQAAYNIVAVVVLVLAIILPLRAFVIAPFQVNGESMSPTYVSRDLLLVNKLQEPKRGDIIVLRPPSAPDQYYVERIVGLPGERVSFKDGKVYVSPADGPDVEALAEPYLAPGVVSIGESDDPIDIPMGSYFTLGDNREASNDSRFWGTLPRENITGVVWMKIWPQREEAS